MNDKVLNMEKNMNNKEYIGKILKINIDRKIGSKHTKHGFIPTTISVDDDFIKRNDIEG